MVRFKAAVLAVALTAGVASQAAAHFLWLVPEAISVDAKVHVYFSDGAHPDRPELLDKVAKVQVWRMTEQRKFESVAVTKGENSLCASGLPNDMGSTYGLSHDYGISSKSGDPKRIFFHAKAHTSADPATWKSVRDAKRLPLEIVPTREGMKYAFTVLSSGPPLAKATVTVTGPDSLKLTAETDEQGRAVFELPQSGLYGIWTKLVDPAKGELDGKPFVETRHLSTLSLPIEVIPSKKVTTTE